MLSHRSFRCAALAAVLTFVGGCDRQDGNNLAALDAQLASNRADTAIQNQIVVDPNLVDGNVALAAGSGIGKPQPKMQPKPGTLGALAEAQKLPGASGDPSGCADKLAYGNGWANRMVVDFRPFPGARLTEAAGSLTAPCNLVVASYTAKASAKAIADHYAGQARQAGFSAAREADGKDLMLGGTRDRDDAAFIMTFSSRADGGTDIDIVSRPKS